MSTSDLHLLSMGSKFVIPEDTIETFRCSLCQNYLSVPPIMIITKDGEQQKCGRCMAVRTKLNTRNKFYENMVKFSLFPCIYPKCKERLQWGEVEDHEEICLNKTILCPFAFYEAEENIELLDFISHCIKNHSETLYFEKATFRDMQLGCQYEWVLVKDNLAFLIFVNALSDDFWVSVFSVCLSPSKYHKYQVKLSSAESKGPFLLYEDQNIIPFDEREHCFRCLADICELKYHPHSKVYHTECEDIKTTKIQAEQVTNLLNTEVFSCTIDLLADEGVQQTDIQKYDFDEISMVNNTQLWRRVLQCPICMEYMVAPIYTCVTGHTICKFCKLKLEKCPTCTGDISMTRIFALEEVSESINISCQYEKEGCNFKGNVERLCRHEEICPSAP